MLVVPYFTDGYGNLSLDVERHGNKSLAYVLGSAAGSRDDSAPPDRRIVPQPGDGRRLEFAMPIATHPRTDVVPVEVVARPGLPGSAKQRLPARLEQAGTRSRLVLDLRAPDVPRLPAGSWTSHSKLDGAKGKTIELGELDVRAAGPGLPARGRPGQPYSPMCPRGSGARPSVRGQAWSGRL